jgi:hypothetical protein
MNHFDLENIDELQTFSFQIGKLILSIFEFLRLSRLICQYYQPGCSYYVLELVENLDFENSLKLWTNLKFHRLKLSSLNIQFLLLSICFSLFFYFVFIDQIYLSDSSFVHLFFFQHLICFSYSKISFRF